MMISKEELDKFKAVYKEEFLEELDDKEAIEKFSRVVSVLRIILYPDRKP